MDWHPASLGQAIHRLEAKDLVTVKPDSSDMRRRIVTVAPDGKKVCAQAPLAGPVRLRTHKIPTAHADAMRRGFELAMIYFGWADPHD